MVRWVHNAGVDGDTNRAGFHGRIIDKERVLSCNMMYSTSVTSILYLVPELIKLL